MSTLKNTLEKPILINDPDICQFYNDNPHISIETANRFLIQLLKETSPSTTKKGDICELNTTIMNQIKDIMQSQDQTLSKDILNGLEMKLSFMLQAIQQPLYNMVVSTEDRLSASVKETNTQLNEQIKADIKYIVKECIGRETKDTKTLKYVITQMYSTGQIIKQTNEQDILLKRLRYSNILLCDYQGEENACDDDIVRFIECLDEHNCNGIFLSQYCGIANKRSYQVDLHNNKLVLYVHKAEYDRDKIQVAIDIIDNLINKMSVDSKNGGTGISIDKDVLDTINNEFQMFISQKTAVLDVMKEHQRKVISQLDELKFPALEKLLSSKYITTTPKTGHKCDLCNNYFANNLKALAAHKRGCIRKLKQSVSQSH